jgi:hypothetical protein
VKQRTRRATFEVEAIRSKMAVIAGTSRSPM